MKKSKSPGAGGVGAYMGTPELNRHLMERQANEELTTRTRDMTPIVHKAHENMRGWPSMYDMARKITKGK